MFEYSTVWTWDHYIFKSGMSPTNPQFSDMPTSEKKEILLFLCGRIDFASKDKDIW